MQISVIGQLLIRCGKLWEYCGRFTKKGRFLRADTGGRVVPELDNACPCTYTFIILHDVRR